MTSKICVFAIIVIDLLSSEITHIGLELEKLSSSVLASGFEGPPLVLIFVREGRKINGFKCGNLSVLSVKIC